MKTLCQLLIATFLVAEFFYSLHSDFHGKKAKEPFGFSGAVVSVVMTALFVAVCWKAGAFSTLF